MICIPIFVAWWLWVGAWFAGRYYQANKTQKDALVISLMLPFFGPLVWSILIAWRRLDEQDDASQSVRVHSGSPGAAMLKPPQ